MLDTHAMYWYAASDPQLSPNAQALIQDASNEVRGRRGSGKLANWQSCHLATDSSYFQSRICEESWQTDTIAMTFLAMANWQHFLNRLMRKPLPVGRNALSLVAQALVEAIP